MPVNMPVGSSSLKIVALTTRAHFYVNPGKNIRNRYNLFPLFTNLKDKVKIDLLEKINYFEYIYNVFILCPTMLGLRVTSMISDQNSTTQMWDIDQMKPLSATVVLSLLFATIIICEMFFCRRVVVGQPQ